MRERFTDQAHGVLARSHEEVGLFDHNRIGIEHFFVGSLVDEEAGVARFFICPSVFLREVRRRLRERVGAGGTYPTGERPVPPGPRGPLSSPWAMPCAYTTTVVARSAFSLVSSGRLTNLRHRFRSNLALILRRPVRASWMQCRSFRRADAAGAPSRPRSHPLPRLSRALGEPEMSKAREPIVSGATIDACSALINLPRTRNATRPLRVSSRGGLPCEAFDRELRW